MINPDSRVLVVDDFELVRTMLQKALNDLGIKSIEQAADGEEARDKLLAAHKNGKPFDIVFADWNMPKMTGFELLQFIRSDKNLVNVPVVMVTAEAERDYVIQALSAGATDYIIKPVSLEGLRKKVESINKRISKSA